MKKSTSWAVLIYGLVLMILGFLGFQKGSQASLYAGTGMGFLLVLSSLALFAKKKVGIYSSMILTVALTAVFSIRFAITSKSLTAILAVLSGAMLVYLLAQFAKWRR